MFLDLDTETILPLHRAHKHPLLKRGRRRGRPVHRATLERWRTRGIGGICLETFKRGGIRCTTVEALTHFFERISDPAAAPDAPTPSQVRRAHLAAEAELDAAGI